MEAKKTILIGSCVRQEPHVLEKHLETLLDQELPEGVEVDYYFIDDSEGVELSDIIFKLIECGVEVDDADNRSDKAIYRIGPRTHEWNEETFDHLARQKQRILDRAIEKKYDYVFLCDSDLMLEKRTLLSLYHCHKPIVSAVFWTQWVAGDPNTLGPNVWLANPYQQEGMGLSQPAFWRELMERKLTHVYGGGACHLISVDAIRKGVKYFPRIEGLPNDNMWQGEDRSFAIRAFQLHQMQFADPWPYIYHAYHPADREAERLAKIVHGLKSLPQKQAKVGDLISFTVEAFEEPALADRSVTIRGRLGGLKMLPKMESALAGMLVGEKVIIEVTFPDWWPEYPGQKRTMRLHLLDAKPYGFPPVLIDRVLQDG